MISISKTRLLRVPGRGPCRALAAAALLGALCVGSSPLAAAESSPEEPGVRVEITFPQPGEVVENEVDLAPVKGTARAGTPGIRYFDVMIALDVSHSTRYPSGIDVDEDGETGFNPRQELVVPGTYPEHLVNTDPDDQILSAEVLAAKLLVGELDPKYTRVGVIAFSGEVNPKTKRRASPTQQDAQVVVPLTADFAAVKAGLDEILARGPNGATNFAAAERAAVTELAGFTGAKSEVKSGRRKVLLFLTDGRPTFPIGRGDQDDPGDIEAAINAARLARRAGVTIHTFALGKGALASPIAVHEMARITSGTFTPVRNPGQITSFLQGVSFTDVQDVVIRNLTTQELSFDVSLFPDGRFSGFVPARPGTNRVRVTALASDGSEGTVEVEFEFARTKLSKLELARELERIKARNKELLLLLERKRIQDFRDRQRKEIVIQSERGD
ncbi:MAG: vWA domain-containing protein [Myxococcota bacterium]